MDKDTTESTFNQVFKQFPYDEFKKSITNFGADKYIKKLFVTKLWVNLDVLLYIFSYALLGTMTLSQLLKVLVNGTSCLTGRRFYAD